MTNLDKKIDQVLVNTGDMALRRRAKEILLNIDPQTGDNILDIGCGDGYYLYMLSNLGIRLNLTGTDFDPAGLIAAKKNLQGKKIPLLHGDLMKKLPFKENTFDKIIMSEVAEHLPDDVKCLKEVRRVLKPNGILCLTVPNHKYPMLWDPINWISERIFNKHISTGFFAGLWAMHIRLYTPDHLREVLKKAGFKIETIKPLTVWSLPFNHNIVHLGARLLHSGSLSNEDATAINKFNVSKISRPWYLSAYFWIVNQVDRLNNLPSPFKDVGVGVFAKVIK